MSQEKTTQTISEKPLIKIRYQLTKNYQVVEVSAELPSDKISIQAPQLLAFAKQELAKIENLGEKPKTNYQQQNNNFNNAPFNNQRQQKDPNALAINSKGYQIKTTDDIPLTNAEVAKCSKHGIKGWTVPKVVVDQLA